MAIWREALMLLVFQRSWAQAHAASVAVAVSVLLALLWVAWVITQALLRWDFQLGPRWRGLFFWVGLLSFWCFGAALGWWLNQWPIYAHDEPLVIVGGGLGVLLFRWVLWRWLARRPRRLQT